MRYKIRLSIFLIIITIISSTVFAQSYSNNELNSVLRQGRLYNESCSINTCGLNGNIRKMTISTSGDGTFYFPFNNFSFFVDGNFASMDYEDFGGENVSFFGLTKDEENYYYIAGQLFLARFNLLRDPQQRVINVKDQEGGETKYTFNYDEQNKLHNIVVYNSWWSNYESRDRREETREYEVTITNNDCFGNWTDLTLKNNENESNLHREFTYYGEPKIISKTDSYAIYSFIDEDDMISSIRKFDYQNKEWVELIPPEYMQNRMPINDFRVVNDYVHIIYMGSAFGTTEVYQYDIPEASWKHVAQSNEDCRFGDGVIIIPTYDQNRRDFIINQVKL